MALRRCGVKPARPGPGEGNTRENCYLHPTVTMESDPWIACPLNVWPVSEAEVSPH
jgi:hypothetical protein